MGVSIPNASAGCPGSNFPGSAGRSSPDGTIVNGPPVFAGGPMGPPLGIFPGGGMFPPFGWINEYKFVTWFWSTGWIDLILLLQRLIENSVIKNFFIYGFLVSSACFL